MDKLFEKVINNRKKIIVIFVISVLICLICKPFISVNYDMNSYLPKDTPSSTALEVMEEEFGGGIPNARVMVKNVSIAEALEYKERIENVQGVSSVTWMDDSMNITAPLEWEDESVIEGYYKGDTALFSVTIDKEYIISGVAAIREIIGDDNAMTGSAVSTAIATNSTVSEVSKISFFAVIFVILVLILTTTSWIEPVVVMIGLGVAIIINAGSNLIFGEISFVTDAAGNILQLGVSLDYSVFLIHRFAECRKEESDPAIAMKNALTKSVSSILSSGLTTVIGFLALCFMRFGIGPDLGIALAKGIAISLIVVFFFMPGLILLTYPLMDKSKHKSFVPECKLFGRFVAKVTLPLAICFVLIIVPSYLASTSNDYYYGASHIFGQGTQIGDDTAEIGKVFGKSDTYVLMVPKRSTSIEYEMVSELKKNKQVDGIIAFVEQAGPEIPYEYLDADTLSKLESENYSRIVISVDAEYEGTDTYQLIDEIRDIANKFYPGEYHLAGEGVSTYDLKTTIEADMIKVNLIAIGAVFLVLLITMKSIILPIVLVLTIESAIWINLSIPYYAGDALFYIAYLIISSIQLGATVDYAILMTDRYKENRELLSKKESIKKTVSDVTISILTSGLVLTVVGFLLGYISTHGILSQLGMLIGKGTLCSLISVLFVLPGLLGLFDSLIIRKTPKEHKEAK